ncbi:MAG: hypothetical protein IKF17_05860 [Clostridia bacterium]|nr:hypothetical protein [Clostridia bacterium]
MLPLKKDIFEPKEQQDPSITKVMDSSEKYSITIMSCYPLTEEQLEVIISVVESDIASHCKPFDISIDISVYTGFCNVRVFKTPLGVKVIID